MTEPTCIHGNALFSGCQLCRAFGRALQRIAREDAWDTCCADWPLCRCSADSADLLLRQREEKAGRSRSSPRYAGA